MLDKYDRFADDFRILCEKKNSSEMIIYDSGTNRISYSYAEIYSYTRRYLTFLKNYGLQKGDTIVTIMPNSPEAIICFFAAMLGGFHYAPLPASVSSREYNNWIRLVQPKIIIKKVGCTEYDSPVIVHNCVCDGDMSWLPLEENYPEENFSSQIYLMTSGTTGAPKAISINSDKLWSSGKAFIQYYKIENSGYRFWNYLPMSYLGGLYNLALIPLCCEGSFVISEPFSGKTMLNYWNFVLDHKVTALWLVPSIIQGLLKISRLVGYKHKILNEGAIKIAFLGTAPIQLNLKEEFEEIFGIRLYENFALSETTFLTAEDEMNIRFREQGSVGRKLPYVSLKFVPVEGVEETYTIWIKTPFLFDGYLSEEGTSELELDEYGYFNSKDLGCLNEDGVLVLSGRSRDIIKKGGQFISLAEVENVVGKLPFIEEVAAVPVKHDFYGEAYVLCVIFKQKKEIEKQKNELHLWILNNFTSYKTPEMICAYDEFPKTASGKIQKDKLLDRLSES